MKTYLKFLTVIASLVVVFSCSDFEEVNTNPTAANSDQVQVEYFLNRSITGAQQNPHIAERIFVLYWHPAGRMEWVNTLPVGGYNDGWSSDYFGSGYLSGWLGGANTAIQIADEQIENGTNKTYTNNLKQTARIWRAYLMSEMADNFGPTPIDAFKGINPDFNSVEEVYMFMLNELDEATDMFDSATVPGSTVSEKDMVYGFDFIKWKQYGNSLRMRLAMRLSEVDENTARQHFEDAVSGSNFISDWGDSFKVQETGGWNDLTGVMTRQWNHMRMPATLSNILVGLGGVRTEDLTPSEMHSYIKPMDYLGERYENHFATKTNNPVAGYWLDGLPEYIDPRALKAFAIPGDLDNPDFNKYPSWSPSTATNTVRNLYEDDGTTVLKELDAKYTWNAPSYGDWGVKGDKNAVYSWPGSIPRLVHHLRDGSSERVFFGSWESYFLIAEAAVRNWNVPMSAKDAYERGIAESFDYWGADHLSTYLNSETYNRVGTSVKWDHTTEASDFTANYVDGYTGNAHTTTYTYPDNGVYDGGKNNDALTKIITQKYIAQNPWLGLETWSDHRRLGLPFFENPAVENPLSNMPQLTASNYMESRREFFPQRLKYPQNIANNVPEGYAQATSLLNGPDNVWTPLWWAQQ